MNEHSKLTMTNTVGGSDDDANWNTISGYNKKLFNSQQIHLMKCFNFCPRSTK